LIERKSAVRFVCFSLNSFSSLKLCGKKALYSDSLQRILDIVYSGCLFPLFNRLDGYITLHFRQSLQLSCTVILTPIRLLTPLKWLAKIFLCSFGIFIAEGLEIFSSIGYVYCTEYSCVILKL